MYNFNSSYEKNVIKNLERYKKCKLLKVVAKINHNILRLIYNCDICLGATIAKSVKIPHAVGIVIGGTAVIEDNVVIMPNVVIGAKSYPIIKNNKRHATIKRNCLIGANSVILGNIEIGENCIIGANSVITKDIPANSLVIGHNTIVKG